MKTTAAPDPEPATPAAAKAEIAACARELGFDAVGFAAPGQPRHVAADLGAFLKQGLHGEMDWLARNAGRRASPRALWPEVATVISLGMNYTPGEDPLALLQRRARGAVSVYARGGDYHKVLKSRLRRLARFVAERYGAEVKLFVDTAPVMEKPAAMRAGIGWQGKHTNLVSRDFGSWLFLGELFTTLALPPDAAEADYCGSCRACLDACPTNAFPAPYRIDATRCISYLTIEHKGHIASEFREAIGNRVYGCDDCLAVCPWNKFATQTREYAFAPRAELTAPRLADLAALDDASFRRIFSGSAIKRLGRDRFVRNALIGLGNSRDPSLAPAAEARLGDDSALVRAMAVWALSRLLDGHAFAGLRARHLGEESDPAVRVEWRG